MNSKPVHAGYVDTMPVEPPLSLHRGGVLRHEPQTLSDEELEARWREANTPRIVPCSTAARWYLALRNWWRG